MNEVKLTNYNEYGHLQDLLLCHEDLDCMEKEKFDRLIDLLKNNGVRYPPFHIGYKCYYLEKIPVSDSPNEYMWTVESAEVKQITYNEFGDWLLLGDFSLHNMLDYNRDIFTSYAMALTHCDKRNAELNPTL